MKSVFLVLSSAIVVFFLTGCSKDSGDTKPKPTELQGIGAFKAKEAIKVLDIDENPIARAQVLIGSSLNQPFANNLLETDANGVFLAPADWSQPLVITISAKGFVRTSFLQQLPDGQNFHLRAQAKAGRYEVKGKAQDFIIKNGDGLVDFALVMVPLKKSDFISVNINKIVSPENDTISVIGQSVSIPSNISLPQQKESYLLPVTLNKPIYRTYFPEEGKKRLFALKGQFPLKKVVDELRDNKEFYEVINYFSLQSGGLREVSVSGPSTPMDIPIAELQFNQTTSFESPAFASDEVLLALALSEFDGELLPTDLKNVPAKSAAKLVTAAGSTPWLINALTKKDSSNGQISAFLIPFTRGIRPELLSLLSTPKVIGSGTVQIATVAPIADLKNRATFAVFSTVTKEKVGGVELEKLDRLWEVYGPDWVPDFTIPQWPNEPAPAGNKRWEVTLVGGPEMRASHVGAPMLDSATHATHSQVDFQ